MQMRERVRHFANFCSCGSELDTSICCAAGAARKQNIPHSPRAEAVLKLARIALERNDFVKATEICIGFLSFVPGNEEALFLISIARIKEGRRESAKAVLNRILQLNPKNVDARSCIGGVLFEEGNFSEALFHAKIALEAAPNDARVHELMGITLTELRNLRKGEFHFGKAVAYSAQFDAAIVAILPWGTVLLQQAAPSS